MAAQRRDGFVHVQVGGSRGREGGWVLASNYCEGATMGSCGRLLTVYGVSLCRFESCPHSLCGISVVASARHVANVKV